MGDVNDLLQSLKDIDLKEICTQVLTEAEPAMADLNRFQLSEGLRADGTDITPPYTTFTIFKKHQKAGLAAVTEHVTLFDKGDHYKGIFAKVSGSTIEFGSTDVKSPALQKKYGKIYGLDDESREVLREEFLQPIFHKVVEELTGLNFK